MLMRDHNNVFAMMMSNGLTLEVTYDHGSSYGVWLLGERFLWWVVAASA